MISAREFSELVDSEIGADDLTSVPEAKLSRPIPLPMEENATRDAKCALPNIYKAPMMDTGSMKMRSRSTVPSALEKTMNQSVVAKLRNI